MPLPFTSPVVGPNRLGQVVVEGTQVKRNYDATGFGDCAGCCKAEFRRTIPKRHALQCMEANTPTRGFALRTVWQPFAADGKCILTA